MKFIAKIIGLPRLLHILKFLLGSFTSYNLQNGVTMTHGLLICDLILLKKLALLLPWNFDNLSATLLAGKTLLRPSKKLSRPFELKTSSSSAGLNHLSTVHVSWLAHFVSYIM